MNRESTNPNSVFFWTVIFSIAILFTLSVIPFLAFDLPRIIYDELGRGEREQKHKEYLEKQRSLVLSGITADYLIVDLEKNWDFRFDQLTKNTAPVDPINLNSFQKRSIINNDLDLISNVVFLRKSQNDILSIKYFVEIFPPLLLTDVFAESGVPYHFLTNAPLPTRTPADRTIFLQWIKSEIATLSAETDSTIKIDGIEYSIKVGSSFKRTYSGPIYESKDESASKYTYVKLTIKKQ